MSGSFDRPDWAKTLKDLGRRVGMLERRTTPRATIDTSFGIMFSHAGELTASTSPPTRVWRGGNLTVLAVSLGTAGSTDTVIDVLRNGTTVGTVTVPSGVEIFNGEVSARFAADNDTLALQVTSAGTGAADMTAEARFA